MAWRKGAVWGGGRTLRPLPGGLVPVLGHHSHLHRVLTFLASASPLVKPFSGRQTPLSFQFPQTAQSSLGQTHLPRSCPAYLFSCSQEPHSHMGPMSPWRLWDGLRDTSSVQLRASGEVAMGQEIQGSRDGRDLGEGTETEHSCSFSPSAGEDRNMLCRQLWGRCQETWEQGT